METKRKVIKDKNYLSMNYKSFDKIVEKKEKPKICANHPVSVWKEGYKRCYWGFKLKQNRSNLRRKGGE